MKINNFLNRVIQYSFYALFLIVPLVFSSKTSELFEFPKMWLTFGLTIIIGTSWFSKMILQRKIFVQRTPLDIPILLFLLSQIISTIFSTDPHISFWGYYSRFNGGLLSTIAYLFLYYALVSSLSRVHVHKLLSVSLVSGFIVALWGIPSHFGYDPTCFLFRGSFDTSCWTEAFKPTIRVFSTLGQPAWLASYVSILIPISIAYYLISREKAIHSSAKHQVVSSKYNGDSKYLIHNTLYFMLAILFYVSLVYTNTRGGFIGFWIANAIFWGIAFIKTRHSGLSRISTSQVSRSTISDSGVASLPRMTLIRYFFLFNLSFLIFTFFAGSPIPQLSKFTYPELKNQLTQNPPTLSASDNQATPAGEFGGTDSGKIRLLVWQGAVDAWRDHPIIGTGVETFAAAYYKYRPIEHNLTSEWDFLYNKAHNEYLNYLATSGAFGLGSYLSIIGTFLLISFKKFKIKSSELKVTVHNSKSEKLLAPDSNFALYTLHYALIASYVSILVTNFFGFSVVITNLYFFLIPAFAFILNDALNPENAISFPKNPAKLKINVKALQLALFVGLFIVTFYLSLALIRYFVADTAYAEGSALNKSGNYQEAYLPLVDAVSIVGNEPVYKDELSINMATIATGLTLQKDASVGAQFAQNAIALNDQVVVAHPHNIVYWKNRVRLFYTLAQGNPENEQQYFKSALDAISAAAALAPNDAKVSYNKGVLLGQTGEPKKAIEVLEKTIELKPDYKDAYFALGLFYREQAVDENDTVTDPAMNQTAIETLEYILKNLESEDKQVMENLKSWRK